MSGIRPPNDADPLAPHSLAPRELKAVLDAERASKPFLVYRDGEGRLKLFVLGQEDRTVTMGRGHETDLSIAWDAQVSGLHAELQRLGGEWTIEDDGLSTNGTFVGETRVKGRQRLRDGDRVRVGSTVLVFNATSASAVGQTVTAGERLAPPTLTDPQRRILLALCRPFRDGGRYAAPASNQQIADELFLSLDAVKMHLRTLFSGFELSDLPQNQKRARLAEIVLEQRIISERDLD
jgi:pSer/pThr/pTyr-binding forkhead associated (FHA) protein